MYSNDDSIDPEELKDQVNNAPDELLASQDEIMHSRGKSERKRTDE